MRSKKTGLSGLHEKLGSRTCGNSIENRLNTKQWLWALSLVYIMTGTYIYLMFRSTNLYVFDWLRHVHLEHLVLACRPTSTPDGVVWDLLIYSLPDGLWVAAFTAALAGLWWDSKSENCFSKIWVVLPMAIGVGSEFGQLFALIPGTFDMRDVSFMAVLGGLPLVTFWSRSN